MWFYNRVTHPKDADGIANSVDPYKTAPLAVWYWSKLFAQICLRYLKFAPSQIFPNTNEDRVSSNIFDIQIQEKKKRKF